ncbi:flagellar hook capping FlgD N-terminal domain-containing protein [Croceicoccus sp. F390]|uniref:Basal-body rod modification protein FlgD n=1 Tax=Croceicoccus esteveae TaxID=3075597 RepID=A0ABU2ZDM8_9SPHN|nr:flagellar hook capping FlgD N-terminal domain-containing protein [Croceicoccus sp. F390]MDT0574705.1 flagellar hook capping FlgD N-terminal domain-containing protein [Croceicoccus sp. F390]
MTVTSATQTIAARNDRTAQTASNAASSTLGQKDFLRLMMTQLQQQDPLEPMDNKDMLAQMAQFSSLAGVAETNDRLADITARLDALAASQAGSKTILNHGD